MEVASGETHWHTKKCPFCKSSDYTTEEREDRTVHYHRGVIGHPGLVCPSRPYRCNESGCALKKCPPSWLESWEARNRNE
jgi:hypothetical protein